MGRGTRLRWRLLLFLQAEIGGQALLEILGGSLEFRKPPAQGLAQVRELLRTKDQKGDDKNVLRETSVRGVLPSDGELAIHAAIATFVC